MSYNNQQQLPYPIDRPIFAPQNINPNALPFVPQGIQAPPWLIQYVPFMTGIIMNQIQAGMGNGPISMFFYNMMVDRNWNNAAFSNLVQDISDSMFLEHQDWQPPPHQIEGAIHNNVQFFLSMRVISTVLEFGQLWNLIDPADHHAIQMTTAKFVEYMRRIQNMRNATPAPSAMAAYGQPVHHAAPAYGQPTYGQPAAQTAQRHQPYTTGGAQYAGGGPGYQTGYGTQQNNAGSRDEGGRSYGGPTPAQQQAPHNAWQAAQQAKQQQPATNVAPPFETRKEPAMAATPVQSYANTADVYSVKWRMSPKYPYPIAFNPTTHDMHFAVQEDGSIQPLITENTMSGMDYDRHAIATLFGKPPAGTPVHKDIQIVTGVLSNAAKELSEELEEHSTLTADEAAKHPTVLTAPNQLFELSLDAALVSLQVNALTAGSGKVAPDMYRMYASIYTPLIGEDDEAEAAVNLSKSFTYIELREKLKALAETSSPAFISEINQRMTAHVNHVLHNKLSITPESLTVTDYVLDLDDLISLLGSRYGEEIVTAFLKDQRKEIARVIVALDPKNDGEATLLEMLKSGLLGDAEWGDNELPEVTIVRSVYSLTQINVLSHDLMVSGVAGVGNSILRKYHPALHELALNVFQSGESYAGDVYRYLVRTKDGRILELSRGNINDEFMMFSLVK